MNRPLWTYPDLDKQTLLRLKSHGFQTKTDVELNIEGAMKVQENIKDVIFNEKTPCTWQSGLQVKNKEEGVVYVTTLSKYLDKLLNGGFETGKLTEIYGTAGSGKTQLCLQLAINVTLPKIIGGLEGESLYIETSKSVFPCRLDEMIHAFVKHVKLNLEQKEQMELRKKRKRTFETSNDKINDTANMSAMSISDEAGGKRPCNKTLLRDRCKSPDLNYPISSFDAKPETSSDLNKSVDSINNKAGSSRDFKISMTRTELDKLINQSKSSKTSLNSLLQDKLNASFVTKASQMIDPLVRSKIHVHYCSNFFETLALLTNAERALKRNRFAFKLMIIDNITFLFHGEDSNYLKRTKNVYFLLNMLSNLATTYNIAVVLVNQLTTKYINGTTGTSERQVVPALGDTFAHRIHTRLCLQKFSMGLLSLLEVTQVVDDMDNTFMCLVEKMVVHNRCMGDKKHVLFQITQHGIRDL